jgi:hypothetical protein
MLLDQLDKYNLHIRAVQEMRWIGQGILKKKKNYILQLP